MGISNIGGLILNFGKGRFKERAYPICKSYPHEPDLGLGYISILMHTAYIVRNASDVGRRQYLKTHCLILKWTMLRSY